MNKRSRQTTTIHWHLKMKICDRNIASYLNDPIISFKSFGCASDCPIQCTIQLSIQCHISYAIQCYIHHSLQTFKKIFGNFAKLSTVPTLQPVVFARSCKSYKFARDWKQSCKDAQLNLIAKDFTCQHAVIESNSKGEISLVLSIIKIDKTLCNVFLFF